MTGTRSTLRRPAATLLAAAGVALTAAAPASAKAHMTGYRVVAASGTAQAHVATGSFVGDSSETWHLVRGSASEPNIAHYGTLDGHSYLGEAHFAIAGSLTASAADDQRSCHISSASGQDVYDGNEPSEIQLAFAGPGAGASSAQVAWVVAPSANIDAATDDESEPCPSIVTPPTPDQQALTTAYPRSVFNRSRFTLSNHGTLSDPSSGATYTWHMSVTLQKVQPRHKKAARHKRKARRHRRRHR